jgi:hypothetical protein
MAGKRTEDDSPNRSSQTQQVENPATANTSGEVAEALARVQEAVIDVKEGALPAALEAAIEAIDSAVREVPDKPEADQLNAVAEALEDALEEVEKGKVANLLPALEEAQSVVEPAPLGKADRMGCASWRVATSASCTRAGCRGYVVGRRPLIPRLYSRRESRRL